MAGTYVTSKSTPNSTTMKGRLTLVVSHMSVLAIEHDVTRTLATGDVERYDQSKLNRIDADLRI